MSVYKTKHNNALVVKVEERWRSVSLPSELAAAADSVVMCYAAVSLARGSGRLFTVEQAPLLISKSTAMYFVVPAGDQIVVVG